MREKGFKRIIKLKQTTRDESKMFPGFIASFMIMSLDLVANGGVC